MDWLLLFREVSTKGEDFEFIDGKFQSLFGGVRSNNGTFANSGILRSNWTSTSLVDNN